MFCERVMPFSSYPLAMMVRDSPWEHNKVPHVLEKVMNELDRWSDEDEIVIRPRKCWYKMRGSRSFPYGVTNGQKSIYDYMEHHPLAFVRFDLDSSPRHSRRCQHTQETEQASPPLKESSSDDSNNALNDPSKTKEKRTHDDIGTLNGSKSDAVDPWQVNVDVDGCDEVSAFIDINGMLTIEGRGQKGDSRMMMRRVTSLPPNVDPSTLKAKRTSDNRLIVSYNPQPQLTEQRKEIPIEVSNHIHGSDAVEQEQQTQQNEQEQTEN